MVRNVVPLADSLSSASLARRSVEQLADQSGAPDDEKKALVVIASELVTNAVLHGGAPIILSVSYQAGEITVEVADGDPRVESVGIRPVDEPTPGGRGLRVVASLADRWGIRRSQPGKTVWAAKALNLAAR